MRLNCYAILPASVRYDKHLSQGAKLLYAELSAGSDHSGHVTLDVRGFSNVLDCDGRTLYRYIDQLAKRGFIEKKDKNLVRLPMGFEPLSSTVVDKPSVPDDLKDYFNGFFRRFETGLSTSLDKKELYYETMMERLQTFSQSEMSKALENRIAFVSSSEWHQKEENRPNATDITLLIKDNSTVLKWLNMKQDRHPVELKKITFQ